MVAAADTRLHAVDAPGGRPALLMLSGGFGTVRNWDRVIRRLVGARGNDSDVIQLGDASSAVGAA
jgi:pimeloyl-ACP methyl ester carboxylesterase